MFFELQEGVWCTRCSDSDLFGPTPADAWFPFAPFLQAYAPGKKYETMSYLPQLSADDIRKQIDYMIRNKWTPCLEFSE